MSPLQDLHLPCLHTHPRIGDFAIHTHTVQLPEAFPFSASDTELVAGLRWVVRLPRLLRAACSQIEAIFLLP